MAYHPMVTSNPKYLKPGQVPQYYPICRTQIYVLIKEGHVKSKVLRRPGNIRGTRLVLVESIEAYINSCPDR
jgi:hypothetical protein